MKQNDRLVGRSLSFSVPAASIAVISPPKVAARPIGRRRAVRKSVQIIPDPKANYNRPQTHKKVGQSLLKPVQAQRWV
jgi:hypothetical protein